MQSRSVNRSSGARAAKPMGEQEHQPNRLLRRQRQLRGWTLEQTADELYRLCQHDERVKRRGDINANMVSQWELGKHTPSPYWQSMLCTLYAATPESLGFVPPLPAPAAERLPALIVAAPQQAPILPSEMDMPHVQAWSGTQLTAGIKSLTFLLEEGWSVADILAAVQIVLQGVQDMPEVTRRLLLQAGAAMFVGNIPFSEGKHLSPGERSQLTTALGESIAQGWKLFATANHAQVLAIGQTQLHLLQSVSSHLDARHRPALYSGVYRLIGAAWHLQGRYDEAYHAHELSYIAALEGADVWNMAQSRSWQANVLREQKRYVEASQVSEAALHLISQQTSVENLRLQAHLFAFEAENAALLGEAEQTRSYLQASATILASLPAVPHDEFDHSSWHQYAGTCALILEQYQTAAEELQRAIEAIPTQSQLRQVHTLIPLAISYAHLREPEASLATLQQALQYVRIINTPTLKEQYIEYLQEEILGAFPHNKQVEAFVRETQHILSMTR